MANELPSRTKGKLCTYYYSHRFLLMLWRTPTAEPSSLSSLHLRLYCVSVNHRHVPGWPGNPLCGAPASRVTGLPPVVLRLEIARDGRPDGLRRSQSVFRRRLELQLSCGEPCPLGAWRFVPRKWPAGFRLQRGTLGPFPAIFSSRSFFRDGRHGFRAGLFTVFSLALARDGKVKEWARMQRDS